METVVWRAKSKTESLIQDKPYPASQAIPDWWKSATPHDIAPDNPKGEKLLVRNRGANFTFKKCTPMLDAITSGYIIPLWADVQVTQTSELPLVTWRARHDIFELHGASSRNVPPPPGYDNVVFKYLNTWIPETPPGYSMMITAPLGYRDLPFYAVPAVLDTDKSTLEVVFPMWIRTGFEGLVEHGTPLVQLTPFKRTQWQSKFATYEDGEYYDVVEERNFNKTIVSHYIKRHWTKKVYK